MNSEENVFRDYYYGQIIEGCGNSRRPVKKLGMAVIRKTVLWLVLLALAAAAGFTYWSRQPLVASTESPLEVSIAVGSSLRSALRQLHDAGVPAPPLLMEALARASGSVRVMAGTYRIAPGMTPTRLLDALARGDTIKESLTIIEGWSFAQMQAEMARHPHLKKDSAALDSRALLQKVAPGYQHPEGLFFPDTYLYERGTSDLLMMQRAHQRMLKMLDDAWSKRAPDLPYANPYEALIMASIVEKETGHEEDRARVASVFVNRMRIGMPLQTDPTVIYGMGTAFDGNLRKQDLRTDTPYNTYTRRSLPPTPISLPGRRSLDAVMHPAPGRDLYFVARGDGRSEFSGNLDDHNRAVNRFQRGR